MAKKLLGMIKEGGRNKMRDQLRTSTGDPFAEELEGMTRGEVKLAESAPAPKEKAPKKEKASKAPKVAKVKQGPSAKEITGALGEGLPSGLAEVSQAMAESKVPKTGPKIMTEMPVTEEVTGLTDAFDRIARQRNMTAKNLMG